MNVKAADLVQPSETILKWKPFSTSILKPTTSLLKPTTRPRPGVPQARGAPFSMPAFRFEEADIQKTGTVRGVSWVTSPGSSRRQPKPRERTFTETAASQSRFNKPVPASRDRATDTGSQSVAFVRSVRRSDRLFASSCAPRAFEQTVNSIVRVFRKRTLPIANPETRIMPARQKPVSAPKIESKRDLVWKRFDGRLSSDLRSGVETSRRVTESTRSETTFDHAVEENAAATSQQKAIAIAQGTGSRETISISPQLLDRVADDVMRRVDRRIRIDRERRGI